MSIGTKWFEFFDRALPNLVLRICLMFVGLTLMGFSVALSRATGLGVSTISAIPGVLSFWMPISIGTFTFVLNIVFVLVQAALLRRDFHPLQLLGIPFVAVFSVVIDLFVPFCQMIPMPNYPVRVALVLLCCPLTAFGVWLQIKAALVILPGDGIVQAISTVFNKNFGKCKLGFDTSSMLIAAIISLATMGELKGVREGTLLMALLVGPIVKKLNETFPNTERIIPVKGHITLTPTKTSEPEVSFEAKPAPLVITISREFGSGGREIAQAVGDRLKIPVYDHSLIDMTARASGLTPEYVRDHEQDVRHGILYNLCAQQYAYVGETPGEDDVLFLAQARTITNLANHGSCVIVGRNANAILADRENVFDVFVSAPLDQRVKRVCRRDGVSQREAKLRITRIDQERREHARLFVNQEWGGTGYDLKIDSSTDTTTNLARHIANAAKKATCAKEQVTSSAG